MRVMGGRIELEQLIEIRRDSSGWPLLKYAAERLEDRLAMRLETPLEH